MIPDIKCSYNRYTHNIGIDFNDRVDGEIAAFFWMFVEGWVKENSHEIFAHQVETQLNYEISRVLYDMINTGTIIQDDLDNRWRALQDLIEWKAEQ